MAAGPEIIGKMGKGQLPLILFFSTRLPASTCKGQCFAVIRFPDELFSSRIVQVHQTGGLCTADQLQGSCMGANLGLWIDTGRICIDRHRIARQEESVGRDQISLLLLRRRGEKTVSASKCKSRGISVSMLKSGLNLESCIPLVKKVKNDSRKGSCCSRAVLG